MIDLDRLIASTAPDAVPTAEIVARHRSRLDEARRAVDRAADLEPFAVEQARPPGRRALVPLLAVAAVVAVVAGLVLLSSRDSDAPVTSTVPSTTPPPTTTTSVPTTTAAAEPGLVTWEPTVYPWLPPDDEVGSSTKGRLSNALVPSPEGTLTIGRLVGDQLTDVAMITVADEMQDLQEVSYLPGFAELDPLTIDGADVVRWEMLMLGQNAQWRPDLRVLTPDAEALIEEIGIASFDVLVDADGIRYPVVDPLPSDYIVVHPAVAFPYEAVSSARVEIDVVEIDRPPKVISIGTDGVLTVDLVGNGATRIDIDGMPGWLVEVDGQFINGLFSLEWQVDEHNWFAVRNMPTAERAFELARMVEPVDRDTWFERYPDASATDNVSSSDLRESSDPGS